MVVAIFLLHFALITFLDHTARTGNKMVVVEVYVMEIVTLRSILVQARRPIHQLHLQVDLQAYHHQRP